jgi:selenocysteine lyase/cysteine desulfurase
MPLDRPPLPRDQFPVAQRWVYLNHAAVAPLPRVAFQAGRTADEAWMLDGGEAFGAYAAHTEVVRASAARLLGASPDEVAFVKNTTEGLGFVAGGLHWRPGDRVVIPDREYPSTLFPFLTLEEQGVEVVRVDPIGAAGELPLEAFEQALAVGRVRMVVLSWVGFITGWRTDLPAITALAHEHGALVCVDAIQGVGLLPCDLDGWDVDVAIAGSHKWLLGPQGLGLLYVARRHLDADTFRVLEPGWNGMVTRDDSLVLDPQPDPTARRYEGGTPNFTGIATLGASVDLLAAGEPTAVWHHVDEWCQTARTEIEARGGCVLTTDDADHRAGIISFTFPGADPSDLDAALTLRGVASRARGGGVRLSPHGWNDADDLARFLSALDACL